MRRLALLLPLWLGLCAATAPVDLMPSEGRSQPFGAAAIVRLTPARENAGSRFGRRPPLDRESAFTWQLRWNGSAYDVRAAEAPLSVPPDGQIAFRPLDPGGPLLIGTMIDPGTEGAGPSHEYFLLWRLSRHEFIGYLRLFGSECEVLPRAALLDLGFAEADIENCTAHNWPQVEALMRAFAATRPAALGTIRLLHHHGPKPRPS